MPVNQSRQRRADFSEAENSIILLIRCECATHGPKNPRKWLKSLCGEPVGEVLSHPPTPSQVPLTTLFLPHSALLCTFSSSLEFVAMFKPTNPLFKAKRRLPLTTKRVPRGYYKGNRTGTVGRHTKFGGFIVDWSRVRQYVVPPQLETFKVGDEFPV